MTLVRLILICRSCRERYTPFQLCEGEPCPKVNCGGTLEETEDR